MQHVNTHLTYLNKIEKKQFSESFNIIMSEVTYPRLQRVKTPNTEGRHFAPLLTPLLGQVYFRFFRIDIYGNHRAPNAE